MVCWARNLLVQAISYAVSLHHGGHFEQGLWHFATRNGFCAPAAIIYTTTMKILINLKIHSTEGFEQGLRVTPTVRDLYLKTITITMKLYFRSCYIPKVVEF